MIKLKNILNENAQIVFPHPTDGTRVANFSVRKGVTKETRNLLIFTVKSSKDLAQYIEFDDDSIINNAIIEYANKQFREIKFVMDTEYQGAGRAIVVDLEPIAKTLNK